MFLLACLSLLAVGMVNGQQAGTVQAEVHPKITWQQCTGSGSCTNVNGEIVLDSEFRWLHSSNNNNNCKNGNSWDSSVCPDGLTCARNCAYEGAGDYGAYGLTTSGNALTIELVTSTGVGSRSYFMQDENNYQIFNFPNKEFTFDVDISKLPCGANGALYFVEMDKAGGLGQGQNGAGAKYGTGYCDAQCPHGSFIQGEANIGGDYGACCIEMDVWEANSHATAYTGHPCNQQGVYRCQGGSCNGVCDSGGCDYNHYRTGATSYYGPGKTVDTNSKFTVVTQFIGNPITEINRFYVQNGRKIDNSVVNIPGVANYTSLTDQFCADEVSAFGGSNTFAQEGGLSGLSASLSRGHVLAFSLWLDSGSNMLWLDSIWPTDANPSTPGVARGDCSITSGVPSEIISQNPNANIIFSNIKFGDIGSTTS